MADRFTLTHPGVDWGLLAAVAVAVATGLYGLVAGRPGQAWVFVVHGVAGLAVVVLVALKLARVARRLRPERLTRARAVSALLAATTLAALATGLLWVFGASAPIPYWTLLFVHMALGTVAAALVAVHLTYRRRPLRTVTRAGRRNALGYAGLVVAGAVAWRLQEAATAALELAGADRRFTGSREDGSGDGNAFPVTSWVADDPDPVEPREWTLSVGGLVGRELTLAYDELVGTSGDASEGSDGAGSEPTGTVRATLDCTSGWYSEHDWRGVRVGELLEAAGGVDEEATWVQFRSVTGYRWSLPVAEAREALLATHVDDEPLAHGHGFPLRLVAPGRRGFQWVKWVERVEVRRSRDLSEVVAIHVSGFDGDG